MLCDMTRLIHMCDMTHWYALHCSIIHVASLIRMCDMTHSCVWQASFVWTQLHDSNDECQWQEWRVRHFALVICTGECEWRVRMRSHTFTRLEWRVQMTSVNVESHTNDENEECITITRRERRVRMTSANDESLVSRVRMTHNSTRHYILYSSFNDSSFARNVSSLDDSNDSSFACVTYIIKTCDMSHSYVLHSHRSEDQICSRKMNDSSELFLRIQNLIK